MIQETGVLERAMTRESREAFMRHRGQRQDYRKDEYAEMASYISDVRCENDLRKLICGDYFMQPPFHYRIPKNFSGRKRDIYTWKGEVKYLLSLLAFVLRDYDSIYPKGLYSFRPTVGAKDFLLKLRDFEHPEEYYCVRADVSNYVASIVPELIVPKLEQLWKGDHAFLKLLEFLLLRRECIERDGTVVNCEPGGLGGIPLANHFMNVYLTELDEYFEPKAPLYCRYSDDILIFARDRAEAEGYIAFLEKILRDKRLSLNRKKTYLAGPGEKAEILGFDLEKGRLDISEHAKAKIRRKLRMHAKWILEKKKQEGLSDEAAAKMMIGYGSRVFYGISGKNELSWARWIFPVIKDTESLKELDHFVQDAIRYVYCGSFSKRRFRLRYEDMKRMGYESIVHGYYHSRGLPH